MRFRAVLLAALVLVGCARLDVDSIDLHEPVVKGGQAEIDAGHVVDVWYLPGIWLAGHRTTHGAVFRNLPALEVGDRVCVYSRCYRVQRIIHWPSHDPPGYLGPVVLQTSLSSGVLLVVAA